MRDIKIQKKKQLSRCTPSFTQMLINYVERGRSSVCEYLGKLRIFYRYWKNNKCSSLQTMLFENMDCIFEYAVCQTVDNKISSKMKSVQYVICSLKQLKFLLFYAYRWVVQLIFHIVSFVFFASGTAEALDSKIRKTIGI